MKRFTVAMLMAGAMAASTWKGTSAQPYDTRSAFNQQDGRNCKERTLRGSYIFTASGFNIVNGVAQPKAIQEVIAFNGDGTLTVPSVTVSVNGAISRPPAGVGDYTVGATCTGSLVFTGGPSFDIVVRADGDTVWMIQTNPNTVFQGTATRFNR